MSHSPGSPMDPGRWRRIEAILDRAYDLTTEERQAFIERACEDDAELLADVESLLTVEDEAPGFLVEPAALAAASLLSSDPGGEDAALSDRTGERVGPFRLLERIGRGGMGSVYLAERADGEFEQRVALKLIRVGRDSDEIARRFVAERQILARLEHPNIARLVDGGATEDGQPWFALEYVEGALSVTRWCDDRRLGIDERLRLFEDVCEAVAYAHRHLIIHRDLKPSNILVDGEGHVKLLDFGIAKLLDPSGEPAETMALTGLWIMTPEYGAPEQVRGDPVTTAADVYALGTVLYELLTGHRAHRFSRLTPLEIQRVVCDEEPPAPSVAVTRPRVRPSREGDEEVVAPEELAVLRASTPQKLRRRLVGDLDTVVAKALHKDASRRYASADAFLDDLRRHRDGLPVAARHDSAVYRLGKFLRRHRVGATAAALVAISLVGGLAATVWQARTAVREAARARAVTDFVTGLFQVSSPEQARGQEITARELLERGVAQVDSGLASEPALQSELYGVLGVIHRDLGFADRADTLLRKGVELAEAAHGSDADEVAARLTDLGTVLVAQGRFAEADSVLTRALGLRRRTLGRDDARIGATLNELGSARKNLGRYDEAEVHYREMMAISATEYGPNSLELAKDLNNLGVLLDEIGRYEEADSALRASLEIRRSGLDPSHPDLLTGLGNLAAVRGALGDYEEQAQLRQEQLSALKSIFPDGHPDVAYALHGLASARGAQGRLGEADSIYREALDMRERWLGVDHPMTGTTRNNLAIVRYRMGRFDEAAEAMAGVLTTWEQVHGPNHTYTVSARGNLGAILSEAGRYAEAEPLLRETMARRRRVFGEGHLQLAVGGRNLGILLHRTGRYAEAEELLREAVGIYRSTFDAPHPRTAEALTALGALLVDDDRPNDARPVLREALEIRVGRLGSDDFRTAETQRELGRALAALNEDMEAESLLQESLRVLDAAPYQDHQARLSAEALAEFYESRGRTEDALRYGARAGS